MDEIDESSTSAQARSTNDETSNIIIAECTRNR